jgi:hypothetical protein
VLRRERGKAGRDRERRPGEKEKVGRQVKGEQRRKTNGIPQGLICNFRKLQGPFCKAKFPINLKPE